MVQTIASLVDGRICPWYCEEDPIPEKFVVIPETLMARYLSGEITDGKTLAKMALTEEDSIVGTARQNVARPPKKAKGKDPSTVDPATIPQGEPTSSEVLHFPKTMRA